MTISDRLSADELEILVQEQTAELEKANQVLRAEIFEREQAEKALRQSEKHYRLLFETMLQGVVYQDADSKIKTVLSSTVKKHQKFISLL